MGENRIGMERTMSDYQAIHDAVRSRITGGNISEAARDVLREANLSHYADQCLEVFRQAVTEYERPSTIYRPNLSIDGDQWCALYGENIQDGVAGFGSSPALAMGAFDEEWGKRLSVRPATREEARARYGETWAKHCRDTHRGCCFSRQSCVCECGKCVNVRASALL